MKITRESSLTGIIRKKDIPVTQEQLDRWVAGELIQNAMPELTEDEREFIKTGATPEEWENVFERNQ